MIGVLLYDIIFVQSDKFFVKLLTKNGSVITRQTISSIEAMLAESKFLRIHRSFIVSLSQIKSFTNEIVEIDDKELPIGKLYRNNFLRLHGSSL
jgi:DNA-binding LytR/AlgR family response regulator